MSLPRSLQSALMVFVAGASLAAQALTGPPPGTVARPAPDRHPGANRRPVADAGSDRTAVVGTTVTLDGTRSTDADGDRLTYRWAVVRRPAASQATVSDTASPAPSLIVDVAGTYVVGLVVHDGVATSAAAAVTIDTANSAPHADAGPDQTARVGEPVRLSGLGSTDADGDALHYAWAIRSAPSGSRASLSVRRGLETAFVPDRRGRYVVRLVVSDGAAASRPAEVVIDTANSAPVGRPQGPAHAAVGTTVSLDGSASTDVDGDVLAYRWALTTVPAGSAATLSDPGAVAPAFSVDRPGLYVAQLIVADGMAEAAPATVAIVTGNAAPVARTRSGYSVPVGQVAVLDGSPSSDPDGDALAYRWALVSRPAGSAATLSDPRTVMPNLLVDQPGVYVAQLVVDDGQAESAPATMAVFNPLAPPVAVAAIGSTVGTTITLDGTGSFDPDGDPLTYAWALIATPAGSAAALSNPTSPTPSFDIDRNGPYVAQLIVNDGTTSSAPVTVSVPLTPPLLVANAGPDQVLSGPGALAQLSGSGSVGTTTFSWTFLSMPAGSAAALSNSASPAPTFTADVAGDYVVQLVVGDGVLTSAPDTVVISTDPPSLVLSPSPLALTPGGGGTLTLSLPAAYAGSGVYPTITLTSSDPSVASVPTTVTIPPGQLGVAIPVTGGGVGGAVITASGGAFGPGRALVGVGAPIVEWAVDASGTWDTPANWSGGVVPPAGSVVLIDRPAGHYTVTVNQPTTAIAAVLATEAVVVNTAFAFTGHATFAGGLALAGTLSGGSASLGGVSTWSSGIVGTSTLTVLPGQVFNLTTTSQKVLDGPAVSNLGTVTWTGGDVYLQGNTAITNAAGAVWNVQGDLTLHSTNCGSPTFSNAGLLRKTSGAGSFQIASCVAMTNTGTIELQSGQLTVAASVVLQNVGHLEAGPGTTFNLHLVTLGAGTTFGGSGALGMNGTTTVTAPVTLSLPTTLTGTVTGPGALTLAAPMTWSSGIFEVTGGLNVPDGQTLTISTTSQKALNGAPLENHGTVTWSGGSLYLQGNTPVTNAAGGVWNVQGDLTLNSTNCGSPTFGNAGLLRKTSGAGTFQIVSCVAMTNTGTIELQSGQFSVATSVPLNNLGHLEAGPGTTFNLHLVTLGAGTSFGGSGSLAMNGTTTVTAPVTLSLPTTLTGTVTGPGALTLAAPMTWSSGIVDVAGGLAVPAGQALTLPTTSQKVLNNAPLANAGTVTWSGGDLYLQGGAAVANATGGAWNVQGDLTLNSTNCGSPTFGNAGLLRKTSGAGSFQIVSCVAMTNTGTIELQSGQLTVAAAVALQNLGHLQAGTGTTFNLHLVTLGAGTTFGGSGALGMNGTTTVTAPVTLSLPTTLTGTVTGSGALTLAAPMSWTSGVLEVAGGLDVAAGRTLTISTTSQKVLNAAPLVNHSTVAWSGGDLYCRAAPP
ncbi:MAG: PKD domain-containing protein [Vicinamibacterales bacterium]